MRQMNEYGQHLASPVPGDGRIYRGTGEPHDGIEHLPPPPPWRSFGASYEKPSRELRSEFGDRDRAIAYRPAAEVVDVVNAALILRRPLLVTGMPGVGKSTLAYSIAYELRLGPVLHWPINRSSTLQQGLYQYDTIARLEDANLAHVDNAPHIGSYIRLGPLGEALLPVRAPRVLLIDDLDKSDIDLPGDLLHVFDAGTFEIPELARIAATYPEVEILTRDYGGVIVRRGRINCAAFPMVIITSSGERDLPPQFRRRCVELEVHPMDSTQLAAVVTAHLGPDLAERSKELIDRFTERRDARAVDQLLNAIYLANSWIGSQVSRERMLEVLLRTVQADDWA